MEDTKIVELYWQRDEQAIKITNQKYGNYCYKIAWNLLLNTEDSEECVNETWFLAWKYIPPKRPAMLSTFLGKLTRGLAIDEIRKKHAAKRPDMHMEELSEEVEKIDSALQYTIDKLFEEKELTRVINSFVLGLSSADRDIFLRRYWYIDSIKDIADRHSCSESRIKSNLYRTRKRLLKRLEGIGYER